MRSSLRGSVDTVLVNCEVWPGDVNRAASASGTRFTQRTSLAASNEQNALKSHQDIVTALACIDSPFRGGFISGDRSGVIKVWRIDALES